MMFICKKPVGEIRPFPVLPSGNCPPDWYQLNPFCYKLFNGPLDWKNAKLNCKSQGKAYDLASIHDFRQHMLLASFLQNDTWIGGTFLKDSKQKIWSDNTPFDYDRFKFVSSDLDQNTNNLCFQMLSDDYKLGSLIAVNCTEEKPYICRTYVDNLIPKPPTLAPDKCENDNYKMISYQDNCYYLHKEKMEWNKGEKFCEAFGPHLAIIADAKENAFVNFYLGLSENDVWIGLTGDQASYIFLKSV
ncbi:C-type lectin BJcuL-like [Centruroides vittatus]|uniref:C-type lectin BJcuL-like n=1 Tax=Centruroides vittatus TaxID=120091 RepID=UPI00350F3004